MGVKNGVRPPLFLACSRHSLSSNEKTWSVPKVTRAPGCSGALGRGDELVVGRPAIRHPCAALPPGPSAHSRRGRFPPGIRERGYRHRLSRRGRATGAGHPERSGCTSIQGRPTLPCRCYYNTPDAFTRASTVLWQGLPIAALTSDKLQLSTYCHLMNDLSSH